MSEIPTYTMRELMEAGVHFGHKTKRWNPKMAPFLFGIRNDVHIIDLQQTVPMLDRALTAVRDIVARNGRVLFVGTKRQAQESVSESAKRCGQYYVNHRWLGGMLTNWKTISNSIRKLKQYEETLSNPESGLTKKERLGIETQRDKLERALGGIRDMGGVPDLIFVIDTNKESIAVQEASKLGIPVVAILDSNSNPDHIAFPVPGNDDSTRALNLYCRLISDAVLSGIEEEIKHSGVDVGASAELPDAMVKSDKGADSKADAKPDAAKAGDAKEVASKESLDKLAAAKSSDSKAKAGDKETKAKKPAAKADKDKKADAPKKAAAKKPAAKKAASDTEDTPAKKAASS